MGRMRVEFADESLARICTHEAHKLGLPIAVIKKARERLIQIESATDERDLRNLKSLNFKKRDDLGDGVRSIKINDQYRIHFVLCGTGSASVATVVFIGDPH